MVRGESVGYLKSVANWSELWISGVLAIWQKILEIPDGR